ncbi:unnamed protein product [Rotaria socialis]|uniref:ISXO2-like transposase domain-containing protein n=1 Tax=Rotaria socialis TaxID=392032 RepID=A0A818WQA3_9BILA|nr:unnamed protein product [Rotaria socialis]
MAFTPLLPFDSFTDREWVEHTNTTEKIIEFCQNIGLIPISPTTPYAKQHNNWYMGACARSRDKYLWRCRTCKSTRSIRDGTFFSKSKLELRQVIDLLFYWSQCNDSHEHLRRHCKFASESTIVDWKNFMRDICATYFLLHPPTIGGVGHIVEIDESSWTKRKYNVGRVVNNQWVFGGTDRITHECFAVLVDRRDAATLLPIIYQYILPGTTIHSDQWAAYNNIRNGPHHYIHFTVNHSQNFVDPLTLTHTQNIENMWMCAKMKKKRQMGQHVTLLQTHLTEFMWRRRFGDRPFENMTLSILYLHQNQIEDKGSQGLADGLKENKL